MRCSQSEESCLKQKLKLKLMASVMNLSSTNTLYKVNKDSVELWYKATLIETTGVTLHLIGPLTNADRTTSQNILLGNPFVEICVFPFSYGESKWKTSQKLSLFYFHESTEEVSIIFLNILSVIFLDLYSWWQQFNVIICWHMWHMLIMFALYISLGSCCCAVYKF